MKRPRDPLVIGMLAASLAIVLSIAPARSETFDGRPKILVHVSPTTSKDTCPFGRLTLCGDAVTSGDITPPGGPGYYFIYLLAARGTIAGLAGLQCGIFYQSGEPANQNDRTGIDIFDWTLCGALEFVTTGINEWPKPGGGNLITWNSEVDCQTGDTGVAGYFYAAAYSADTFSITDRPVDGLSKVASCLNEETNLVASDLGCAHFSSGAAGAGCNPCLNHCFVDPVEVTTWSRIKTIAR